MRNVKEKRIRMGIALVMIILLVLIIAFCSMGDRVNIEKEHTTDQSIEVEGDNPWDGKMSGNTETAPDMETITIPGYANLYVSDENRTIRLVNPEDNTVYLQYSILNGEETVYETKAIKPGNMVEADLYSMLVPGEYELSFVISTYDINTQESCNGAVQSVNLLVK